MNTRTFTRLFTIGLIFSSHLFISSATGQIAANNAETKTSESTTKKSDQWTQWRGVKRDSRIEGDWPETLNGMSLKQVWSKKFGPSYSGPIVVDGKIFTTETRDKKEEVVTALDAKTGDEIWKSDWKGSIRVPFFAAKNGSWIRSTPATDGERLFVAGILGRLTCLDVKSGKEVWAVDLNKRYGTSAESFGHVCSPLIRDENGSKTLYIQSAAGLIKMDRLTGKEIWRSLNDGGGMMSGGAFSSPIVSKLAGKEQMVVQTRSVLAGVDMESGKVLWRQPVPAFRGMNILTPTVLGNKVFTSSYQNKSFAYVVAQESGNYKSSLDWSSPARAYMSSPVLHDGHAYVHLQNRQVACFDVKSGETKWISKNRKRFGEYWSMVGCGDKILALDSDGVLYLLRANSEKFEQLGSIKLETDNSWAHLAVVGDMIYVRGLESLTAYQWSK